MTAELPLDREDVTSIMEALLDIRADVSDLHGLFFEDDEGQEEEEPQDA